MKVFLAMFFVLIGGVLITPETLNAGDKKVIKVSTGEFPPYTVEERDDKGCVNKLLVDAFKSQGYEVEISFLPWQRAYDEAKSGKFDATAYWYNRADRRADLMITKKPVTSEKYYFFYNKQSKFDWKTYVDLKGKAIVLNRGYTYSEDFIAAIKKYKIERFDVDGVQKNFEMILADNADLTMVSAAAAEEYFKKLGKKKSDKIVRHPVPGSIVEGYIFISKDVANAKDLKADFDKGMEKVLSDSEYKKNYQENCSKIE